MKILNLHGFMGEADNKNYKALCGIIPAADIISPKINYMDTSPEELLAGFADMARYGEFVFVGQSLGGWFADRLSRSSGRPCILTNPCNYPHMLELITASGIPAEFLEQYRDMPVYGINEKAFALCSDEDTLLPGNYTECVKLFRSVRRVHGSHSTIENIGEHILAFMSEINSLQA